MTKCNRSNLVCLLLLLATLPVFCQDAYTIKIIVRSDAELQLLGRDWTEDWIKDFGKLLPREIENDLRFRMSSDLKLYFLERTAYLDMDDLLSFDPSQPEIASLLKLLPESPDVFLICRIVVPSTQNEQIRISSRIIDLTTNKLAQSLQKVSLHSLRDENARKQIIRTISIDLLHQLRETTRSPSTKKSDGLQIQSLKPKPNTPQPLSGVIDNKIQGIGCANAPNGENPYLYRSKAIRLAKQNALFNKLSEFISPDLLQNFSSIIEQKILSRADSYIPAIEGFRESINKSQNCYQVEIVDSIHNLPEFVLDVWRATLSSQHSSRRLEIMVNLVELVPSGLSITAAVNTPASSALEGILSRNDFTLLSPQHSAEWRRIEEDNIKSKIKDKLLDDSTRVESLLEFLREKNCHFVFDGTVDIGIPKLIATDKYTCRVSGQVYIRGVFNNIKLGPNPYIAAGIGPTPEFALLHASKRFGRRAFNGLIIPFIQHMLRDQQTDRTKRLIFLNVRNSRREIYPLSKGLRTHPDVVFFRQENSNITLGEFHFTLNLAPTSQLSVEDIVYETADSIPSLKTLSLQSNPTDDNYTFIIK